MNNYEKNISAVLSGLHSNPELQKTIDIDDLRIVVFSDHHRGEQDGADDFRHCKPAYHAALGYYLESGYTLYLLGDVEELWECHPGRVVRTYRDTLNLEREFARDARLIRFYGNHDDHWGKPGTLTNTLRKELQFAEDIPVYESVRVTITSAEGTIGEMLFLHGHQGETLSDRFSVLSRWIVRYIWRPFQRLTKIPSTTPATSFELRKKHELAQYQWASSQSGTLLFAGHTHHPVFSSQSHESYLHQLIDQLREEKKTADSPAKLEEIQNSINHHSAELQWVLAKSSGVEMVLPPDSPPCYFNTGCCSFGDGDITGLEIADGEIRLIRWPDDQGNPRRKILRRGSLREILERCA